MLNQVIGAQEAVLLLSWKCLVSKGCNDQVGWEGKRHRFTVQMGGGKSHRKTSRSFHHSNAVFQSFQLASGGEAGLTGDLPGGRARSISELETPRGEAPLRSGTVVR